MLLATIVHIYLKRARQQVNKERKKEWKGLVKSFHLLDTEQKGYITFEMWNELMVLIRPKSSEEERSFLFNVHSNNGETLDIIDFLDLREITQLHLTEMVTVVRLLSSSSSSSVSSSSSSCFFFFFVVSNAWVKALWRNADAVLAERMTLFRRPHAMTSFGGVTGRTRRNAV
jgi:hypothetical protein